MHFFSEKKMLRIFVIVIIANAAIAQVPFLGTCPNLEAAQHFDVNKVSIDNISRINNSLINYLNYYT